MVARGQGLQYRIETSQESAALVAGGPEPAGRPEAVAFNGFKSGKPKDLVRLFGNYRTHVMQTAFRRGDHQHAKLRLAEPLLKSAGQGQLQVVACFLLPNTEGFGAEIDFQEHGSN